MAGIEFFKSAFDRKNFFFFGPLFSRERVKHLPIEKFSTIIDDLFCLSLCIYITSSEKDII